MSSKIQLLNMKSQNNFAKNSQKLQQIYTLKSKPTSLYSSQDNIYLPLADRTVAIFNLQSGSLKHRSNVLHTDRINCIKQKDNLLITGSSDGTVKLWDMNLCNPIATFQKIGNQFNCVDKSGPILAAAYSSKIIFWDLRTGKQRSQFTSSFNGQITNIQFDLQNQTVLMGCSSDGMINKFDLKQPNEEQSLIWCTKIMQSPSKLHIIDNMTLVQTTNHLMYLLQQEAIKKKIQVNNIQMPKHVVHSKLIKNGQYYIQNFNWNIQNNYIEHVINEKVIGIFNDVNDVQVFCPLNNNQVFYVDQNGNVFVKSIDSHITQSIRHIQKQSTRQGNQRLKNHQFDHRVENQKSKDRNSYLESQKRQNKQAKNHKQQKNRIKKIEQQEQQHNLDKNGYILQKHSSLKNKHKKFKPY